MSVSFPINMSIEENWNSAVCFALPKTKPIAPTFARCELAFWILCQRVRHMSRLFFIRSAVPSFKLNLFGSGCIHTTIRAVIKVTLTYFTIISRTLLWTLRWTTSPYRCTCWRICLRGRPLLDWNHYHLEICAAKRHFHTRNLLGRHGAGKNAGIEKRNIQR